MRETIERLRKMVAEYASGRRDVVSLSPRDAGDIFGALTAAQDYADAERSITKAESKRMKAALGGQPIDSREYTLASEELVRTHAALLAAFPEDSNG